MGKVSSSSSVHIQNKSLPIMLEELVDHKARVGECHVLRVTLLPPYPTRIEWYNKGKLVPSSDSKITSFDDGIASMTLTPLEITDDGEWNVRFYSPDGADGELITQSTCNLSIVIPKNYRKPKFMENLKAILTEEGLVSFECKVVGFPTPQLRWYALFSYFPRSKLTENLLAGLKTAMNSDLVMSTNLAEQTR